MVTIFPASPGRHPRCSISPREAGTTMTNNSRGRLPLIATMCAIGAFAISLNLTAAAEQLTQATTTSQTTNIASPYDRAVYTATLQVSFDWGDLGPDWQTKLGIEGNETLWFRWKIGASAAAKGRWELSSSSNVLLAQGEVGAAQTPGDYALFLVDLDKLNLPPPPYYVRLQALTSTGTDVGQISAPVVLDKAVPGPVTCFTDGGLGLPIADKLEAIRAAHGVPALGGAVVTTYGLEVFDAVGVRKLQANPVNVTKYDKWHLGSDTKAMTSMLVGLLRQYYPSIVAWNTTVADAFPEWAATMDATFAQTTLRQLLAHRSGLYLFSQEQQDKLTQPNSSVTERRRAFAHAVAHDPYLMAPGVMFKYENANYIIAGAMLENLFGQSWESLITQYLFE